MPTLKDCLSASLSGKPGRAWSDGDVQMLLRKAAKSDDATAVKAMLADTERQLANVESLTAKAGGQPPIKLDTESMPAQLRGLAEEISKLDSEIKRVFDGDQSAFLDAMRKAAPCVLNNV